MGARSAWKGSKAPSRGSWRMRSWLSAPCGHERPRHCIRRPTQSGNWDYYLPDYGPVAGHTGLHDQASRPFPRMHPQLRVFPDLTSAIIFTHMVPQSHRNRPMRRCWSSLPRLSRKTRYPYRSPSTISSGVDAPNQFSVLLHGPRGLRPANRHELPSRGPWPSAACNHSP